MKKGLKIFLALLTIAILGALYFGFSYYQLFFKPNFTDDSAYIYIKTGSKIEDLYQNLEKNNLVIDIATFKQAAEKMHLAEKIKPGRYALQNKLSNRTLINAIKAGNQSPLALKIHNLRTVNDLSGYIGKKMECDSAKLLQYILHDFLPAHPAFTADNIYTVFIPNTYDVYWNASDSSFMNKMYQAYQKFWDKNRLALADSLKLSPQEVTVLASIVDAEALYDKEMPTIAGLYLNRLRQGTKLEADPTVIFAHHDFTIRRVTYKLLALASPYNTYYVKGLPPGPIMMPSINAIDAVLHYNRNSYIYMCAKEDFSGYHNFASTQQEHNRNAKLFREALDKRKIFK